jgi:hypothetical protein
MGGSGSSDDKLSPELIRRLVEAVMNGPAERLRQKQIAHFKDVDRIVRLLDGCNEERAADWFDRMLEDARPGTESFVLKITEDIKAARSAKLSS